MDCEPFSEPVLFRHQWHLLNKQQSGGKNGEDINVCSVWDDGFMGDGVIVGVVDDGSARFVHPDLFANFRSDLSWDFNDSDSNPSPSGSKHYHGTAVAGLIGALASGNLGVGVAPRVETAGLRLPAMPSADRTRSHCACL